MQDKIVFRELLSELKNKAAKQQDKLTKEEIQAFLGSSSLTTRAVGISV
jgi:hypothetical protein